MLIWFCALYYVICCHGRPRTALCNLLHRLLKRLYTPLDKSQLHNLVAGARPTAAAAKASSASPTATASAGSSAKGAVQSHDKEEGEAEVHDQHFVIHACQTVDVLTRVLEASCAYFLSGSKTRIRDHLCDDHLYPCWTILKPASPSFSQYNACSCCHNGYVCMYGEQDFGAADGQTAEDDWWGSTDSTAVTAIAGYAAVDYRTEADPSARYVHASD